MASKSRIQISEHTHTVTYLCLLEVRLEYGHSQGSIHSLKSNLKLQDFSELLVDEGSLSVAEMKTLSTSEAHLGGICCYY